MFDLRHELKEMLIKLALPLLVGHLAIIGLSITDISLSGHISRQDLGGVTLGATLFDLPMLFVLGIFIANSSLVGRFHGRDDHAGLNLHFRNTLWLALPIGLLMALAVHVMRVQVLPLIDAEPGVRQVVDGYLVPMAGTAFLLPVLIALRTTLEATGHPGVAMAFNLGGFLVNIPLDLALMHGWGPLPALGGAGAGWATLIVVCGITLGILGYIHFHEGFARLRVFGSPQKPSLHAMGQILVLGTPMGGAILAEAGFFHFVPLVATQLGTLPLAAHAIAMSFDMTMFIIPLAIAQAITIRTAGALGRNDAGHARYIAVTGVKAVLALSLLQMLVVALLCGWIPTLYTEDQAVAALAATLLFVAAFIRVFDGVHIAGSGVLRGYGKTREIFLISVSAFWLIGAPVVWLCAARGLSLGSSGIQGVWIGTLVAVGCACAMTLWQVRRTLRQLRSAAPGDQPAERHPG